MIELGLQRIQRLLATTHLPWRAIHVAGTNGKGSICAYVSGMLEDYNNSPYRQRRNQPPVRHGKFVSPHLIWRWDCISVDHQPISMRLFHEVENILLQRNRVLDIKASEFETLTAIAFEIFTREKVDVAVVEVGMGGRLDATNVLGRPVELREGDGGTATVRAMPLVTAIAKIGLDHQGFLGNTLEEIGTEKAGIIKPGVPVVYDNSNEASVLAVFDAVAARNGTRAVKLHDLHLPPVDDNSELERTLPDEDLRQRDPDLARYDGYGVPNYRRNNTSVAFRATWLALQQLGRIPEDMTNLDQEEQQDLTDLVNTMLRCTSSITIAGRIQSLDISALTGRTQPIILDGAHNAQSAIVLAEAVKELRAKQSGDRLAVTWVLAASDTKDVRELLTPLLQSCDTVFAVEFGPVDGMPWVKAMPGDDILRVASEITYDHGSVRGNHGRDVVGGLEAACRAADGGPLVMAGSLYLVGDVLRALEMAKETDS